MMGIFLEYVIVYVAGKACEEHNACEGTAFEEWTLRELDLCEDVSNIFGIRDGLCCRQSLRRT